jgi:hypothetical protein
MYSTSRKVVENLNNARFKEKVDFNNLKTLMQQLFASKKISTREYKIFFFNRIQTADETIQRYYSALLELAEKAKNPEIQSVHRDFNVFEQLTHGLSNITIKNRFIMDYDSSTDLQDVLYVASKVEIVIDQKNSKYTSSVNF